ncbi:hypothetical protein QFC19_008947 [Naganishia cerealis]|uniref:Uncharacterized protein n=1 Tax=Naganishia cerealis TaxID=610337 RepID=A0ACC2UYB4_9TREE|nr:hypothetical protein QFC19_008947 [Naganishia cerealis]
MNGHRRNKPGPKLSLSGFFGGADSSGNAGARASPKISPSQLRPTRIIDANPPSEYTAEAITSYEGVPVLAVVRHEESSQKETAQHSASEDPSRPPSSLKPVKHIITFPIEPANRESIASLVKDLKQHPTAPVEIQCVEPGNRPRRALDDAEWHVLGELVDELSGFGNSVDKGETTPNRSIIIAGLLPPPLHPSYHSTRLHTAHPYSDVYLPRLTELSLNAQVYLKLLPPILDDVVLDSVEGQQPQGNSGDSSEKTESGSCSNARGAWWTDEEELKRVMRLYVTPAMECFGSHRVIFGSSPAVALSHDGTLPPAPLISPQRWFVVAKTVVSELVCGSGEMVEAQAEMDAVFYENASRIWGARVLA